ncbi:MAG: DUF2336 domain-containing protein [Pseudolabrys sp.]
MSAPKLPAPPYLDSLVDLASRTGIDVRPTLLRVLTDLYVQKPSHPPAETAQFVELAGRLIEAVDPATRGLVAGRLAAYPAAPAVLLQRLVDFGALPHLPELSRRGAPRTAVAAPLEAAKPVTSATLPSPVNELAVLFFKAAPDERRSILANIGSGTAATRFTARPDAADIARRLEAAALQRNAREFATILERSLFIGGSIAEMIANDAGGEPIVVVAKAIGMPAETLQRILMFLNPKIGQSAETVYRLNDLFHEASVSACAHMLENFRDAGQRRRVEHQPLHYDDDKTGARASATPGAHQAPVRRGGPLVERYRGSGR